MAVAVADAHALIWYALGPHRRLGRRARALFARAERGEATIHVPTIVLAEIAEAARRGVIRCEGGFSRWAEQLLSSAGFLAVALTWDIVREAESLYIIPERGDRLIAATAAQLGVPLITNDQVIARVPGIRTVW